MYLIRFVRAVTLTRQLPKKVTDFTVHLANFSNTNINLYRIKETEKKTKRSRSSSDEEANER